MPEAVLSLKLNPKTGERILIINYESDLDALPFEHEDDHRAFVERLLGHPLQDIADHLEIKRSPPHPIMVQDRSSRTDALQQSKEIHKVEQ